MFAGTKPGRGIFPGRVLQETLPKPFAFSKNIPTFVVNRLTGPDYEKLSYLLTLLLLVTLMTGCKAFHTLMDSKLKAAQGAPYELIVVCNQQLWESELGDTLRSVLLAPIPYLNEREPLFNVMQFPESGFKGTVVDYRNILKVLVDPSLAAASAGVQYDVTASPQVVVTLQGPTREALTQYVAEHRAELVQTFEGAERDRSIAFANKFNQTESGKLVREKFGVEMKIPKGYILAQQSDDFLWFRYEFPAASQGFMLYSYPYEGKQSLSEEALLAARNRFAARIPGPSDGSYMTTSKVFTPRYRFSGSKAEPGSKCADSGMSKGISWEVRS